MAYISALHSTCYILLGKEAHTWQTVHTPLYSLTVWIAWVIHVLCRSTISIPVDQQIHSVNLHHVIVLPSFVFIFPHVFYYLVIFVNILHFKKAATLTIFCMSYFSFFPKALLYSFVFAIQTTIAIIIVIQRDRIGFSNLRYYKSGHNWQILPTGSQQVWNRLRTDSEQTQNRCSDF